MLEDSTDEADVNELVEVETGVETVDPTPDV
jgi:hypothetical protein